MIVRVTISNTTGEVVTRRLKLIAALLVQRLKNTTPGRPKDRWAYRVREDEARVTNPAGYLRYLDTGTGLYGPKNQFIVPRQAKVLHWTENGKDIFVKRTKGVKPQRFISDALQELVR